MDASDMVIFKTYENSIDGTTVETVNARELHEFLQVRTAFSHWITRRVTEYEFSEHIDFIRTSDLTCGNPNPAIEYFLTFSMAKELCMIQNSERGKQARRYFIWCEQQAKEKARQLEAMAERYAVLKESMLIADPEKWEERFKEDILNHICRIYQCKRGSWLRQVLSDIFYKRTLEPWARAEIRRMNPRKNGGLTHKDHQFINHASVGGIKFMAHMEMLRKILPKCQTKDDLVTALDFYAPKLDDRQGSLPLLPGGSRQVTKWINPRGKRGQAAQSLPPGEA